MWALNVEVEQLKMKLVTTQEQEESEEEEHGCEMKDFATQQFDELKGLIR